MKTKLLIVFAFCTFNLFSQTNLVPNGDFENWTSSSQPDNWFKYFSGFASQSNSAQNGTSSTNMMIADGTFNFINSEYFPVEANKTYRITLYHKLVSGSFSSIDLSIYHKPSTFKEEITKETDLTFSSSEWRKIEFDYTSTVSENIEVDIWATGTLNSEILVDNVSVIDVAELNQSYTLIPDLNFENKLISLGIDSGVADGKVLTNNVNQLTSLNVSSSSIVDLTGIQDFVGLTYLNCGRNQLTNLDVTKNTALTDLYCFYNQITSIDVSQNINLKWLMCHFNELTSIDVSNNPKLELFDCLNNKITSLDISKNPLITELACENNQLTYLNLKNGGNTILDLTYSNFVNNPNLSCIQVDDVSYSNANWASIKDITANYSTDCTPYTLIPDVNFENKLIALGIDSGIADGKVDTSKINTVTYLDVSSSNITDMTGIQDFVALTYLDCNVNNIKTIDVSNNKFLTKLALYDNQLTNLDVTKNTQLINFECSNNQISSIDLSQNPKLLYLSIGHNQLSNLDISANIDLESLYCHNNDLTSLDVSKQTSLLTLDCGFNNITSLDLSTNTKLEGLYCYNMKLTALELSNNILLKTLNAISNQLTTLDLSKNKDLNVIYVIFNPLTELNVQNGNNKNFILPSATGKTTTNLYCSFANNSNLGCIKVDDEAYSNANWANIKDITASYSTDCTPYTLIPDSNFEQKLIDLGIDTDGLNGKVVTASINQVTFLDVADSNISDLTGLQDFTALIYFFCDRNKITTVDFTKNLMLENIGVLENNLTNIDIRKNTKIHTIELSNNQITSVDLSQNTNLKRLGFENNKITEIDLTNNTELWFISGYGNQLTSLDLSQNKKIEVVNVDNNQLTAINVQNGNNKNFVLPAVTSKPTATNNYCSFANNNKLECIKVDDEAYSNANWANIKDATATYSSTCSKLGIEDSVFDKVDIYPNPTQGELHIDNIVLEKATVYDALGKLVKTTTFTSGANDNTMHLEGISSGVYYIYLETEGANTAKKIIVE